MARRAEEIGYSTLLMPDHFAGQVSALPALAHAAAVTTRLRVGTIVCDNDFRHPILLAKEAATIDLLSNGRFELGIGAGWLKAEHDALGIPFDTPLKRVDRLAESVQVIKSYFRDDHVNFSGEHYRINGESGLDRVPVPVQKPHPPILIGAGGKRMLALAAREADIIGIAARFRADGTGPDLADLQAPLIDKIEHIRAAAGNRFQHIELNVQTWAVIITDDREQAAAGLSTQFPLSAELLLSLPFVLIGTLEEIAERLLAHRDQYGISYYAVFDQYMEAFAPVVRRLSGK